MLKYVVLSLNPTFIWILSLKSHILEIISSKMCVVSLHNLCNNILMLSHLVAMSLRDLWHYKGNE